MASGLLVAEVPWQTAAPESLALDKVKLDALRNSLAARRTKTFVVVRKGRIVYEWYAPDSGPAKPHYTASLAKALVGGTALLLALNDGRLSIDDPAWKYIPAWKDDPVKSRITIRHLATHSSGIQDANQEGKTHEELTGWMGALAYAVTASLKGAPEADIRRFLKRRVMDPLGIPEAEWSIGYGRSYPVDGLELCANWGGGSYTARAVARVGQWMLQRGEWEGRRLIAPEWVDKGISYAGTPLPDRPPGNPQPGSGLGWWTNHDGVWPSVPRDAFAGAGNQVLLVVPSLDLVVVRNGGLLGEESKGEGFWGGLERYLFNPLMEAIVTHGRHPVYPPSPVIGKVSFAPWETIVRAAPDSDNWPITWADDDHLYTSYGDGWGFEPRTEQKLSQGFARIIGPPEDFRAENVRSPSGERLGDGAKGAKASGMLSAGGVLYMWVRNTGNSQLVWSEDRARTWHWGFRFEESFGSPAFLNFGKDHAGARDEYVYTYSQDGPSAYESNDALVLARVPKDRIRDRQAYEFFVRLDDSGRPLWRRDIGQRGPVFAYPGRCRRVDAVYHPVLRRYLLALGYDHEGGWGIFDAPEPWGPWTTAFHTDYWGLGDAHGYRLPSKWISPDGRTMHLVFSGHRHNGIIWDAFCLRKMTLETAPSK